MNEVFYFKNYRTISHNVISCRGEELGKREVEIGQLPHIFGETVCTFNKTNLFILRRHFVLHFKAFLCEEVVPSGA